MNDINFKLNGLTCEVCVKLATIRIKKVSGVHDVVIDLATGNTNVCGVAGLDLEKIAASLEGTHYSIAKV